jgi:hypothetical protein
MEIAFGHFPSDKKDGGKLYLHLRQKHARAGLYDRVRALVRQLGELGDKSRTASAGHQLLIRFPGHRPVGLLKQNPPSSVT